MWMFLALVTVGLVADPPDPNAGVLAFARSMRGRTVGDGDCAALASEALRQAGARRDGGAWGKELSSLTEARPGDVLQFENTVFVRTLVHPDGSVETRTYRSARHVAIVSGVRRRGKRVLLSVLQQNITFEGAPEVEAKVVSEGIIDTAELRRGTLKAYRPVAGPPGEPPG